MDISDDHMKQIAEAAGKKAAHEVLLMLGVDASTPGGVQSAQRNWAFLTDLRVGTSAVKRKVVVAFIGSIVTAIVGWAIIVWRSH